MPKSVRLVRYFLLVFLLSFVLIFCFSGLKSHFVDINKMSKFSNNYLNPIKTEKAYALDKNESVSKLINVLTQTPQAGTNQWPWVIEIWKWSLALANLILVLILLGIGIINIMHIQYDTYQIKKALPLLIIGVVLANLSLFIIRMLLYAANILTDSFMQGGSAGAMAKELITAVSMSSKGNVFLSAWSSVGGLLIAVIFGLFAAIGFIILGFMFYMRYAAIVMLAVAAPLAFVLMAFPPTQGLFKQWWSWATRFIFMKPLALFFLFVAWQIQKAGGGATSITAWIIKTALVYFAILVPWKLGGVVASMWGGVGKWASTPVRDWAKRRGRQAALMAKRLPGIRHAIQGGMADEMNIANQEKEFEESTKHSARMARSGRIARQEEEMKRNQLERDIENSRVSRDIDVEMNGRMVVLQQELDREKGLAATHEATTRNALEEGTYVPDTYTQRLTGVATKEGLKTRYNEASHNLATAEAVLKKRRMIDLMNQANAAMQRSNDFLGQVQGYVVTQDTDENGETVEYDYGKSRARLSALRNELATETDEEKRAGLMEKIGHFESSINSFEQQHPEMNFRDFLDKNGNGRMMARVNPELAGEVDAIVKSETTEQIFEALENGGGTSEFTFTREDVQKVLSGRANEVSANARYGIQSYMMSAQYKLNTSSGSDKLIAVSKAMETFEKIAPGASKQIRNSVKENMSPKAIEEVNNELASYFGPDVTVDNVTADQLMQVDITRQGSRVRDFVQRISTKYHDHVSYGTGASPGAYTGRGSVNSLSNQMQSKPTTTITTSTPGGAERVLQLISTPDENGHTIVTEIDSAAADVLSHVSGADLTEEQQNAVLSAIVNHKSGDTHELETTINQIPGLSGTLRVNIQPQALGDVRALASRASIGRANIRNLAIQSTTDTAVPHYNTQIRDMTIPEVDALHDIVVDLSANINDAVNSNIPLGSQVGLTDEVDHVLQSLGHTREERERLIREIDTNPDAVIQILRNKNIALTSAKKMKRQFVEKAKVIAEKQGKQVADLIDVTTGKPVRTTVTLPNGRTQTTDAINVSAVSPEYSHKQVQETVKGVVSEVFGPSQSSTPPQTPPPATTPPPTTTPPTTTTTPTPPPTGSTRMSPEDIQRISDMINQGLYRINAQNEVVDQSDMVLDVSPEDREIILNNLQPTDIGGTTGEPPENPDDIRS